MKTNRIMYMDILNVISCIAVIYIHCNGLSYDYMNIPTWKHAIAVECIACFCVPVFLMITGANLLEYRKRYDTKTYFKKRFIKIVPLWIICSFILFLVTYEKLDFKLFIYAFVHNYISIVYWFLPLIIFIYCIIPFISILTEKKEYKNLLYLLAILIFIIHYVVNPICAMLNFSKPGILKYFNQINPYILYVIVGYLVSKKSNTLFSMKQNRIILYTISIILMILKYVYIIHFSSKEGMINRDILGYLDFMSFFYSLSIFIFFKHLAIKDNIKKRIVPIFNWLSNKTYIVYLVHIIIITIVTKIFKLNVTASFYRWILPFLVYILSIIITYILQKAVLLKKFFFET